MKVFQYAAASVKGGLIDHVVTLVSGLAARGHAVTVALSPAPDIDVASRRCATAGAQVERLMVAGKSDLDGMLSLRKLVSGIDPDIAHLHLASPVEAIPALASVRLGGARRMVTTEHAPTHFPLARSWSHLSKRIAGRWLDAVIALSRSDAEFLREEFGVPDDRIRVIPNGVTPDPRLPDRSQARARLLAGHGSAFWIGFAGALEEKKGVLDLLEGAKRAGLPDAVLLLAGEGRLAGTLRSRATESPVPVALTGHLADLSDVFAAVDVFVLPSHQEAMPLALLQAMAAGIPSIATRVGGIPEMIDDGVSGLLIAPKAPQQIAAALVRLASEPGLALSLGRGGCRVVQERYTADRMIDGVASLYSGIAGAAQEAV